jgi:SnoaL-like domain
MADTAALIERIGELEHRLARLEDEREIAALFAADGEIEIGRRGGYRGRARVRGFLEQVLGEGRWGLLEKEIINHIELQTVITVAADRQTAGMRSRALIQGNSPPGQTRMPLAEGLHENEYVRCNGRWLISRLWWDPTYYFTVPGFETAVFEGVYGG